MGHETLKWLQVIHTYSFLTWIGALTGLSFMLKQHSKAVEAARADFLLLEKSTALAMDIGATITMIVGVIMLVGIQPSLLKGQGGFMHAKLTVVLIIVGIHGFQRMRLGKYKRGKVSAEPGWLIPVLELSILAVIVLIVARPF